jgi:hypothetical protein
MRLTRPVNLPGNPGIDNTSFVFFVLTAAFVFFVTVRGDLPKWLGLFGLANSGTTTAQPSAASSGVPAIGGLPALPALSPIGDTMAGHA